MHSFHDISEKLKNVRFEIQGQHPKKPIESVRKKLYQFCYENSSFGHRLTGPVPKNENEHHGEGGHHTARYLTLNECR